MQPPPTVPAPRYPRTGRREGRWRQASEQTATARHARATLRRSALRERLPTPGPSKAGGGIAFEDGEAVRVRPAARAPRPRLRLPWPLGAALGRDWDSRSLLQEPPRVRAAACRATPRHPPRRLLRRRSRRTGLGWSRSASESDQAVPPHPRRRARSPDRLRRALGPSALDPHRFRPRPRLPPVPGSLRPSARVASETIPRPVHGPAVARARIGTTSSPPSG